MRRKVFFSYHFESDAARTQRLRALPYVDAQPPVSANDWSFVKRQGEPTVRKWIETRMRDRDCLVLLIGAHTLNRPVIALEIEQACALGLGLLGIHVHGLPDEFGLYSLKGLNPFTRFRMGPYHALSDFVTTMDPAGDNGESRFAAIEANLADRVEGAVRDRALIGVG